MIAGLGARSDHIATVPNADPVRLNMTPEESQLFACVGRVARIDDVLARCGLEEPHAIAVLLALRAKGAIAPARVQRPEQRVANVDAALLEEIDLDLDRKRELLELEKSLERVDFFALFKVPPGSEPGEVKKAYYEASRKFHPDRFFGKNLGSYRARIERIFRKFTEAYETLTTPDRRREYLSKHPHLNVRAPTATAPSTVSRAASSSGVAAPLFTEIPAPIAAPPQTPEDHARTDERRARFARHPYLARAQKISDLMTQAKTLAAQSEFERAIADLTLVTQIDPKNHEAAKLIGELKKKNDVVRAAREIEAAKKAEQEMDTTTAMRHYKLAATLDDKNADLAFRTARLMHRSGGELKEAKALAQRAVELEPARAEHHQLLGMLMLDAGMKKVAKRHFEDALKADPQHAEAKAQLKKLRWTF